MSISQTPVESPIDLIRARPVPRPGRWISAGVLIIIVGMIVNSLVTNPNYQWRVVWQWLFSRTIMIGVQYTLILTVLAMVLGTTLAITMAVMRQSPNPVLRSVSWFYIWFFRGTPVYTQLIFWSLLPVLYPQFTIGVPFGPDFFTFTTAQLLSLFWMAVFGLGFNEGAYLAEIIRAGINSVDRGQWEAATALGMSRAQVMRRIILPQAMRVIVPPLGNETISMLKTTSLVAAIPFTLELTFAARTKGSALFAPVPLLICAAIWYLVVTSILMVLQHYIEAYFGRGFAGEKTSGKAMVERKKKSGRVSAAEKIDTVDDDPFLEVTP